MGFKRTDRNKNEAMIKLCLQEQQMKQTLNKASDEQCAYVTKHGLAELTTRQNFIMKHIPEFFSCLVVALP